MDPRKLYMETMAEFAPLADQIKAVLMSPDDVTGRKTAALSWKEVKEHLTVDKAKELLRGSGTASNVVRGSIGALAGAGLGSMTVSKRSWESEEEYRRRKFRASMGYALTAGAVAGFAKPAFEKYVALSSAEDARHENKVNEKKLEDIAKIEETLLLPDGTPRTDSAPLVDNVKEKVTKWIDPGNTGLAADAYMANAATTLTNPTGLGGLTATGVSGYYGGRLGWMGANKYVIDPAAKSGMGRWGTAVRDGANESAWLDKMKKTVEKNHPLMREGTNVVTSGKKIKIVPDPNKPGLGRDIENMLKGPGSTLKSDLKKQLEANLKVLSSQRDWDMYNRVPGAGGTAWPKPKVPMPLPSQVADAKQQAKAILAAQKTVGQVAKEFEGSRAKRIGVRASGGAVGAIGMGYLGNWIGRQANSKAKAYSDSVAEALRAKRDAIPRPVPVAP